MAKGLSQHGYENDGSLPGRTFPKHRLGICLEKHASMILILSFLLGSRLEAFCLGVCWVGLFVGASAATLQQWPEATP